MSAEYTINADQLQELIGKVQQTKRAQTVRVADGVVAIVKPDRTGAKRLARRRGKPAAISSEKYPTIASLAGAAGSLPFSASWQDIRESARDEHLATKFGRRDS